MALALLGAAAYTVTRYDGTGDYTAGLWVEGGSSTFDIVASVQPINGRELEQLPEGLRTRARLKLYTETELVTVETGRRPDRVAYGSRSLEVQAVESWMAHTTGLPHFRYVLAEPGEDGL